MKHFYCILIANMVFISSYAQLETIERTHYLFPDFTQGVVLMKSGAINKALLNYNSVTEEMIFDNKGTKLAIPKTEMRLIDTVFIRDRKFIVLNNNFLELIYRSNWNLYVEHKCKMTDVGQSAGYGGTSETSAIKSYSAVLAGRIYDLELPDNYELEPYSYYWIMKNGDLDKFVNLTTLRKLYKSEKDLFNAYVKKHDVKYDNQESIIQLIEYMESN